MAFQSTLKIKRYSYHSLNPTFYKSPTLFMSGCMPDQSDPGPVIIGVYID